ncbi:unnamed protein product, partial [Ectocarpus sp. 4 AP-2014]
ATEGQVEPSKLSHEPEHRCPGSSPRRREAGLDGGRVRGRGEDDEQGRRHQNPELNWRRSHTS